MAFEAMDAIKKAEAAAAQKKTEALQEAKRIAALADAEGKNLLAQVEQKAQAELLSSKEEENKKMQDSRETLAAEVEAELKAIRAKGTEKLQSAVDFVVERIVNS